MTTFNKPHPASLSELKEIITGYRHAAEFLQNAGFDGIQLHAAHGYLLAQFLSLTTNRRDDEYGNEGNIMNRARLILKVAKEIRRYCRNSFILGIKINSVEFQEGGFQPHEAKQLCEILEEATFDFVELSGGTYEEFAWKHKRESTIRRESYFLEFADAIVPGLFKTKVYVTGGFKTVSGMVDALNTVDGIGLGRPITVEPRLGRDILDGKIKGIIKQAVDSMEYMYSSIAAGSHMVQVSKGRAPTAMSSPEMVNTFMQDFMAWVKETAEDGDKYGWMNPTLLPP